MEKTLKQYHEGKPKFVWYENTRSLLGTEKLYWIFSMIWCNSLFNFLAFWSQMKNYFITIYANVSCFFSLSLCCQKIYRKDYNTARKILLGTMQYYEDFFIWKSVVCYGFSGDKLVNQFSSSILLNKLYAKLSEHYYRTWEIWVFSLVRILPEYWVIVVVITSAQLHLTVWTQIQCTFKSCLWHVGYLLWWESLTKVSTGNKA